MYNYLKLVRYPNLLIIVFTQYAMRWGIVEPMLEVNDFSLQLSSLNFFFLVLATVCLTAAGYVINDYFDTHTDFLNRPKKVLVGTKIHRRAAMMFHIILNIVGVGFGVYVSFVIDLPIFGLVFLLVSGILWFYSTTYKRQFLVGNILVALLTALVPLMVVLFEIPELNEAYKDTLLRHNSDFMYIFYWVLAFSFFAFITNLMREIVKDAQDFEGDNAYGRNSLPVVLGINTTKTIVQVLAAVTIGLLVFVYFRFLGDTITLVYFSVFLVLPLLFLMYKIIVAKTKADFRLTGILLKFIMLFGILYAFIARYIILNQVL
jgi:4-hydroxybenzoate polyprenyltransferase